MPLNVQLFHSGVSGMKDKFNKKVNDHKSAQELNPFSAEYNANLRRHSKEDVDYGRPISGSKTEARAQAAQFHVMMEIKYLCNMIWDCAEHKSTDGRGAIGFGKLFKLYICISDKVVGTLLRARKHGYVAFEGEMLYQRRDDNKIIELAKSINTIRAKFGMPPHYNGGEVQPWVNDDDDDDPLRTPIERRNSASAHLISNSVDSLNRRSSMPVINVQNLDNSPKMVSKDTSNPAEPVITVTDFCNTPNIALNDENVVNPITNKNQVYRLTIGSSGTRSRSRSHTRSPPSMITIKEDKDDEQDSKVDQNNKMSSRKILPITRSTSEKILRIPDCTKEEVGVLLNKLAFNIKSNQSDNTNVVKLKVDQATDKFCELIHKHSDDDDDKSGDNDKDDDDDDDDDDEEDEEDGDDEEDEEKKDDKEQT